MATTKEGYALRLKVLRKNLGLTQKGFVARFPIAALSTLRKWEQGGSGPSKADRILIQLIEQNPRGMAKRLSSLVGSDGK